ncbi:hypothetical protein LCGC14_0928810 [marine sediment metagenome]|uniref:Uncharacterized protein n=1 Tax=marine sediment metagenome TaxID=412755 RepID=A0A0F9RV71_9ZZZZ
MKNNNIDIKAKQNTPAVLLHKEMNELNSHDTHNSNKEGHKGHMDQSAHQK